MIVYICSPVRGDTEANRRIFADAVRHVIAEGHTPVCPQWLAFIGILNDGVPADRKAGMDAGIAMVELLAQSIDCEGIAEMWVFGWAKEPTDTRTQILYGPDTDCKNCPDDCWCPDLCGRYLSQGMIDEINLALDLDIPVRLIGRKDK